MSKLLLIDGHSILNRAFYGVPDLTNSEGIHTNAMYGFLNIMFKFIDEEKPDYVTVAFDLSAPTFRHKVYDGYKGTRKPMLPELRQQVPLMKELLTAMNITIVEKEGSSYIGIGDMYNKVQQDIDNGFLFVIKQMVEPTTREKILAIMDDNITVQRHTRDNIDFIVPNKVYLEEILQRIRRLGFLHKIKD